MRKQLKKLEFQRLTNWQLMAIGVLVYSASKAAAKFKTLGEMYTVWHILQLKDYLCFKSEKEKIFLSLKPSPIWCNMWSMMQRILFFDAKSLLEVWKIGLWVSNSSWMIYFFMNETKTPIKSLHMKSSRQKGKYPMSKHE